MVGGCGPGGKSAATPVKADGPKTIPGVEVHAAAGRPRLSVVRRDGDPSAAIAIELRGDEPLHVHVAASIVAARLEKAGFTAVEVLPGARVARVRALAPQLGAKTAAELDQALVAKVVAGDPALPAVRAAVDAFAGRPVEDRALTRAARCLDRPTRPSTFKAPSADDLQALAETSRAALVRVDRVVVGAVGSGAVDAFAQSWRALPVLPGGSSVVPPAEPPPAPAVTITHHHDGAIVVVEGGPRGALPGALAALLDGRGPLDLRLRAADDWRARGIAGVAHDEGACIVVEVEPSAAARAATKEWNADRFAMRAAVAAEVARQEVELALERVHALDDDAARSAIGSGGDPREAADRAAWWSWPLQVTRPLTSSTTLAVAATAIAKAPTVDEASVLAAIVPKYAQAVNRARLAWTKNEIELRSRVEAGQGELWAALGTPCGVAHEGFGDAGLASVAARALVSAQASHGPSGVAFEPWASTTGVGIVAHAPTRAGENATELAHRVGDALGRLVLASFPAAEDVASARADSLVALGPASGPSELVRSVLRASSPLRPSFLDPMGTLDAVAKVGLEQIDLRLATLRAGPLRLAVLANAASVEGEAQADAAARAAERWVPRRPGETRACPLVDSGASPKGALHPVVVKTGTGIAFAYPVEENAREAAQVLAAILGGPNGRLATEVGTTSATSWDARVVRGTARHAFVIVVLAPDGNVDLVVSRLRGLLDRVRGGAVEAADLARADAERANARIQRRLDPRARVVDLFSGDLGTPAVIDLAQARTVAAKIFDEDSAQVVVARLSK